MHPPIHPHAPAFACVRWFASACCTGWRIEDSVPSLSCLFSSSRSPVSTSARRAVRRLPLRGQKDQLAKASHKNPARPQVSHRKVTSDQRPHLSVIQRTERDRSISIGCREAAGAGRAPKKKKLGARHMTLFSPARLRGAQMRRCTTLFPALLRWVLASASSLKPMGRGLVHLAMISTASGWRIPSQESQRQALAGNVERARDRRRLADNCNGMWSVTRSHPQSLAQPNLDVRCPSCAPQRQRGFLWDSLVKLR